MAGPKGSTTATAPYPDSYSGTKPTTVAPPTLAVKTIKVSDAKPGPRVASYPDSFAE